MSETWQRAAETRRESGAKAEQQFWDARRSEVQDDAGYLNAKDAWKQWFPAHSERPSVALSFLRPPMLTLQKILKAARRTKSIRKKHLSQTA